MSFRKMLVVLSVAMIIIILCLFGVSYAYYSLSNAATEFNASSSNTNISVVYEHSQNINFHTGYPINDDDASFLAATSRFNVFADSYLTGYNVAVQIDLVDIVLDDVLKISDFKFEFYRNDVLVTSFTGADLADSNTYTLQPMSRIAASENYDYELRVWLHDTGVSQNEFMNKIFKGKFEISSSIKK